MKNQTSGALIAPEPAGVHVSENLKVLNGQVNNLQRRYYRSLAPDCEVKTEVDKWYFRAILKKLSAEVCGFKKNVHLCSAFHFEQATTFANFTRWHFLCPMVNHIVPTPVWSVNAPTACSRWNATGKRNFFLFPSPSIINILFHFNCIPK